MKNKMRARSWVILRRIETLCMQVMREKHAAAFKKILAQVNGETKILDRAYQLKVKHD